MKRVFAFAVVPAVLLTAFSIAKAQANNVYFTGHGVSSAANIDASISASRATDGTVRGELSLRGAPPDYIGPSLGGTVVELVPPAGSITFWCVNVAMEGGGNIVLFIKDLPAGDQLSYASSGTGLACATTSPEVFFELVDTGDFVGEIVPDTCAGDLATCNAQVATLTSQLGQCQADLNICSANLAQCQTDLADCTDKCELPLLPTNYDAKLTGAGFYEPLNTKVKISATRTSLGTFKGAIAAGGQWQASVTDLVAPYDGKPYWCVNSVITSAPVNPSLIGQNVVLFLRDSGKGCDPLSYVIGPGLDCDSAVPGLFTPISAGDFKGQLRCGAKQCCPN